MIDSPDPIDVNLTAERLGRTGRDLEPASRCAICGESLIGKPPMCAAHGTNGSASTGAATPPQPTAPWQPIETAPKDGRLILTAHGDDYRLTMWVEYAPTPGIPNGISQWSTGFGPGALRELDYNPTRWMPIPPASPTPTEGARRYFTNINGFSDDASYVIAAPDGRCFIVTKDGSEMLYTAGTLARFEQHVKDGKWRELTASEANGLRAAHGGQK